MCHVVTFIINILIFHYVYLHLTVWANEAENLNEESFSQINEGYYAVHELLKIANKKVR